MAIFRTAAKIRNPSSTALGTEMTLDIRGSIKNTKLSSNPYVVFEELISNAIDSFLIRKHVDASAEDMRVEIEVEFNWEDLLDAKEDMTVFCKDNGCGLGDDQLKAFLTKDTSYKDDLSISGIGSCKGAGRIQFFHHFSGLAINSTYRKGGKFIRREMHYSEPAKQIDAENFSSSSGNESEIGTTILLKGFKEAVRGRIAQGQPLSALFSASVLKKQMLIAFLQRLVGLDRRLGNFKITFVTRHWKDGERSDSLTRSDLPAVTAKREVKVEERDPDTGDGLGTYQHFTLYHYQLNASEYGLPRNAIAFCAKSSPVKDITQRYLRTRAQQNNPVDGSHHIVLIESDYLDQRVNEQRDDFENIPAEISIGDLFSGEKLSYATIYDAIDPVIEEMVVPANWNKDDVLRDITNQFGISEAMLQDTSTRIVYGETPQAVAERVLKKYQERVVDETAAIYNLKEEIIKAEPDSEEFRALINDLAWKYTSSLKNFDMANLSQLIVRRAAIVQILDLACNEKLAMQTVSNGARRKNEQIIHNIFFPMRKDSSEVDDHDIWLLSEEYHYYDYIASDVPLANIAWNGGEKIFERDIDVEIKKILEKRASANSGKRPDIAIFSKEGSAIIIEFKAPGVHLDDYVGDLAEYSHLLAAKSGGKLKKIYGYLIGDTVNALRLSGWTPFPLGNGYFRSDALLDPKTRYPLGETYFEILYFSDVIERAKKRIGIYQNKLQLKLDPH
ncbi:type I restriction enzyme HsdR N-terminal domain-containing protein [Caballeronia glathei]|uniref:type I restriction enzyme HsdR N-terminal domain-containing protein n=1 Tax=Caballeronia glathei TaxID=60547 RepID=UPI001E3F0BE1|nr:type I restriction enzyme HsdR N-terminal domain-containing protein [Caballeronia glathei]